MSWVKYANGWWAHRPLWKVAVNCILRTAQLGRKRRWLVVTHCDMVNGYPVVLGYGFRKVEMRDAP